MNTTQIRAAVVHTAVKEKLRKIEATYLADIEDLNARALQRCSMFASRRTPERAALFLKDNYCGAQYELETQLAKDIRRIRGLNKLIQLSTNQVIEVDEDTAFWLWCDEEVPNISVSREVL